MTLAHLFSVSLGLSLVTLGGGCTPVVFHLTQPSGVIETPGFPGPYSGPLCRTWVIDSGEPGPGGPKVILLYLTQFYLKENFSFSEYAHFNFEEGAGRRALQAGTPTIVRWTCRGPACDLSVKRRLGRARFYGISLEVRALAAADHFRSRNFLNVYGFNITYEIRREELAEERELICSVRNCSMAGNCLATRNFGSYYCDCLPGRSGRFCEYNGRCNPKSNTTFCLNGGTCRSLASREGYCYCPEGFTGQLCETKIEAPVRACPGSDCAETCDSRESLHRPCSCHTGRIIPKGWIRYEGTFQSHDQSLPVWDSRSSDRALNEAGLRLKQSIEEGLTRKLQEIPELSTFEGERTKINVTVVSFEEASKFSFQFFGPNTELKPNELKSKLTNTSYLFPDFRIQDSLEAFVTYPALALKNLTIRRGPNANILRVGGDFSISCVAEGSRRVTFKWFKDKAPINPSLALRQILEKPILGNSNLSTSILMFDSATDSDRGTFTCQVSDMGEEQCQDLSVELVSLPIIQLDPMSLTLRKEDRDRILICTSENESRRHNFSYTWTRNDEPVSGRHKNEAIERLEPYGSILRIIRAVISAKYTCIVSNNAGQSMASIEVSVLEPSKSETCRAEIDESGLYWDLTGSAQTAKIPCPAGYTGFVQRKCHTVRAGSGKWAGADFSRCVSNQLRSLNRTVQSLKMGFANETQLVLATQGLHAYLIQRKALYTGEGEKVVSLLNEIGRYALKKPNVVGEGLLGAFLNATARFLQFPASCSSSRSLLQLSNLIHSLATTFSNPSSPNLFHSNDLVLERLQMNHSPSLIFPRIGQDWMRLRLEVPNHPSVQESNEEASILFVVFRNLTYPLADRVPSRSDVMWVSPVVSFTSSNYYVHHSFDFSLTFNLSTETVNGIWKGDLNLTCAGLSDDPESGDGILWKLNACPISGIMHNISVECSCNSLGQYAVLVFGIEKPVEVIRLTLHWSVAFGTSVCIIGCGLALLSILLHVHCQIRSTSLYTVKLLVCSSLILSVLLSLSIRTDASSVALSTWLTSFLILSLCCQVTKSVHVLLLSQPQLFPWLRTVPILTLLMGLFIGAGLPVWTAAAVLSHSNHREPAVSGSVLAEGSPVFGAFVAVVTVLVFGFIIVYYKAVLKLRTVRLKDSGKVHIIDYRMKTLNRALTITLTTLITTLASLLQNNGPSELVYQYFFGMAAFTMGLVIFFSYTIKSEYPIPGWLATRLCPRSSQHEVPDPEKPTVPDPGSLGPSHSRTPEKAFEVGTVASILLPNGSSQPRTRTLTFDSQTSQLSDPETTLTLAGSSILSTSNSTRHDSFLGRSACSEKRPSIGSNSRIPRSASNFSGAVPWTQQQPSHPLHTCGGCCRKTSRASSSARYEGGPKPQRGLCLLFEAQNAEYVLPSSGAGAELPPVPAGPKPASSAGSDLDLELFPAYMNGEREASPKAARELSQFMTFRPGRSERSEAVYESIKSRSGSRLGREEEAEDKVGLPPELPATNFPRRLSTNGVRVPISGRNGNPGLLYNETKTEEPGSSIQLSEFGPKASSSSNPGNHVGSGGSSSHGNQTGSSSSSNLSNHVGSSGSSNHGNQTKSLSGSNHGNHVGSSSSSRKPENPDPGSVLGKIHRDLDYLLERTDQDKLQSSENLKL